MANIEINAITSHFRGKVGDVVFRRTGSRMIGALRPRRTQVDPTEAALTQRRAFRKAIDYANDVMADPVLREVYARAAEMKEGRNAFNTAVADFFTPPTVESIDTAPYKGRAGDKIGIAAQDDVDVMSVRVVIQAADHTVLEQGDATMVDRKWLYTATTTLPAGQPVTIEAIATDRPNHRGTLTAAFTMG